MNNGIGDGDALLDDVVVAETVDNPAAVVCDGLENAVALAVVTALPTALVLHRINVGYRQIQQLPETPCQRRFAASRVADDGDSWSHEV